MKIGGGSLRQSRKNFVEAGHIFQQGQQRARGAELHAAHAHRDAREVAQHLQCVAKALFGVEEQGALGRGLAGPAWNLKRHVRCRAAGQLETPFVIRPCAGEIAFQRAQEKTLPMGLRIFRRQFQSARVAFARSIVQTKIQLCHAQQPVRVGVIRLLGHRLLMTLNGLGQFIEVLVSQREVLPHAGVICIQFNRLSPGRDGFTKIAFALPAIADGIKDLRIVGVQCVGGFEAGARRGPVLVHLLHQPQLEMGGQQRGLRRQCFVQVRFGFIQPAVFTAALAQLQRG